MKNRKLSARAVVSLMLSAILFCMPVGAFFANRANTVEVHAEDTAEQKTESAAEEISAESTASGTDNKDSSAPSHRRYSSPVKLTDTPDNPVRFLHPPSPSTSFH